MADVDAVTSLWLNIWTKEHCETSTNFPQCNADTDTEGESCENDQQVALE